MIKKRDECMMCGIKESHIKLLEDVAYFSQLLIDSMVCYDGGDMPVNKIYLDVLKDKLDEISP